MKIILKSIPEFEEKETFGGTNADVQRAIGHNEAVNQKLPDNIVDLDNAMIGDLEDIVEEHCAVNAVVDSSELIEAILTELKGGK